uniref:Uncharacterized protein n=1 Tax=Hucho hucho TaxID=62062 RepID=A0A4W5LTN5_9TELE
MDLCPESDGFIEVMPYDHFQPLPRWEQGPWTECSVSCGESGGLQERSVVCVEDDAHGQITQVEEWKCTHSPRPITQQSCNSFTCPQWVAMEWSQVSNQVKYQINVYWVRTQLSRCYSGCSEMLMLLASNNAVKCQTIKM